MIYLLAQSMVFISLSFLHKSTAVAYRSFMSSSTATNVLISAPQLKIYLSERASNVKVIDASWHLSKRDGKSEYFEAHIPGAVFFDIDEIADKSSTLPHMLPRADFFSEKVSALGICNDDTIVVYNTKDSCSAARCWWTFKIFGLDDVKVLQGGLPAWIESGGDLESGKFSVKDTKPSSGLVPKGGNTWMLRDKGYKANLNPQMVRTWRQVLTSSNMGKNNIIDARSIARFEARAPEPRAGLAGGHIPNSICIPFTDVLATDDITRYKTIEEIKQVFESAGVDIETDDSLITTCGSGVTAAVITFALHLIGRECSKSPVYDGAWAEWGSRNDLPIEV